MDLYTPSAILSEEDVQTITGYQKPKYQRDELLRQGVPFRTRHDGVPIVSTWDVPLSRDLPERINKHMEEPNFEGL